MSPFFQNTEPTEERNAHARTETARGIVTGKALCAELLLVLVWMMASDWLIYRVGTFPAWGLFFLVAILLLWLDRRSWLHLTACLTTAILLGGMGLKLIWCGDWLQVFSGLVLLLSYSMALAGTPPFLPEALAFLAYVFVGGPSRLFRYRLAANNGTTGGVRAPAGLQFVIPLCVVSAFTILFVLANPDLSQWAESYVEWLLTKLSRFLKKVWVAEVAFWIASGLLFLGLLHPSGRWLIDDAHPKTMDLRQMLCRLYFAFRNTLICVNILFAGYLVFEFATLWFREFPTDFYYAGYAHEGAFWLTVALAFSTVTLSFIFSGTSLQDPRLPNLKRLAILWSLLNLLLAIAVVNRLFIYIDFNGMTRMRVVGLLGTGSVATGFGLVVFKVLMNRSFIWLVHRQLWVPILAFLAYSLLPVDWFVNQYNVQSVLRERTPAVVQIIAHRTSAEGMLPVTQLASCEHEITREGVRALLALWAVELGIAANSSVRDTGDPATNLEASSAWESKLGHYSPWISVTKGFSRRDRISPSQWENFQLAEYLLRSRLNEMRPMWESYTEREARNGALNRFFRYAYPWY